MKSMKTRSRRLGFAGISVLLATSLVVGCSSDDSDSNDSGSNRHGNTDVATGGNRFATADSETAKLGSDAADGVFPRTVVHSAGSTEIPAKPTRIVVLDSGELDGVLALGVTPVGAASAAADGGGQPAYLADRAKDIESVGTFKEPDLEKIAALDPDLILGSTLRVADFYDELSAIAPTVFSIRVGFPWKENFLLYGDAMGEEAKARDALNAYQDHVDEVRKTVLDMVDGDESKIPTVSMVRFLSDRIRLYGNLSFIGVILKDVGLNRPANENIEELAAEVSPETINLAAGDWIFYASYGDGTSEDAVVNGPLWAALPAVKAGQAHPVADDTWYQGLGPIGAEIVLDQMNEFFG